MKSNAWIFGVAFLAFVSEGDSVSADRTTASTNSGLVEAPKLDKTNFLRDPRKSRCTYRWNGRRVSISVYDTGLNRFGIQQDIAYWMLLEELEKAERPASVSEFHKILMFTGLPQLDSLDFLIAASNRQDFEAFESKWAEKKRPYMDTLFRLYEDSKNWTTAGTESINQKLKEKLDLIIDIIKLERWENVTDETLREFKTKALSESNPDASDRIYNIFSGVETSGLKEVYSTVVQDPAGKSEVKGKQKTPEDRAVFDIKMNSMFRHWNNVYLKLCEEEEEVQPALTLALEKAGKPEALSEFVKVWRLLDSPKLNATRFLEVAKDRADFSAFESRWRETKKPFVDALSKLYEDSRDWTLAGSPSTNPALEDKVHLIVDILIAEAVKGVTEEGLEDFITKALSESNQDAPYRIFHIFEGVGTSGLEEVYRTVVPDPAGDGSAVTDPKALTESYSVFRLIHWRVLDEHHKRPIYFKTWESMFPDMKEAQRKAFFKFYMTEERAYSQSLSEIHEPDPFEAASQFCDVLDLINLPTLNSSHFNRYRFVQSKWTERKEPYIDALLQLHKDSEKWTTEGTKSTNQTLKNQIKLIVEILKAEHMKNLTEASLNQFKRKARLEANAKAFEDKFKMFKDVGPSGLEETYNTTDQFSNRFTHLQLPPLVIRCKEDTTQKILYYLSIAGVVCLILGICSKIFFVYYDYKKFQRSECTGPQ